MGKYTVYIFCHVIFGTGGWYQGAWLIQPIDHYVHDRSMSFRLPRAQPWLFNLAVTTVSPLGNTRLNPPNQNKGHLSQPKVVLLSLKFIHCCTSLSFAICRSSVRFVLVLRTPRTELPSFLRCAPRQDGRSSSCFRLRSSSCLRFFSAAILICSSTQPHRRQSSPFSVVSKNPCDTKAIVYPFVS